MITIIKNASNLTDNDINKTITRVKALIINNNNEILLGYSYHEYQFPGGHVENGENLNVALKRELQEETGLDYDTSSLEPFAVAIELFKDYPKLNNNTKVVIYYYEIKDDRIPDLNKTNYTDEEIDGNFVLRYVPLTIVEDVLRNNMINCGDSSGIALEMLDLFKYYFAKNE